MKCLNEPAVRQEKEREGKKEIGEGWRDKGSTCTLSYLFLQTEYIVKVGVVNVGINTKQTLKNRLGNSDKVTREINA